MNEFLYEMLLHKIRAHCIRKCIPQCGVLKLPFQCNITIFQGSFNQATQAFVHITVIKIQNFYIPLLFYIGHHLLNCCLIEVISLLFKAYIYIIIIRNVHGCIMLSWLTRTRTENIVLHFCYFFIFYFDIWPVIIWISFSSQRAAAFLSVTEIKMTFPIH